MCGSDEYQPISKEVLLPYWARRDIQVTKGRSCMSMYLNHDIVHALRYVNNYMIHKDLGIPTVHEIIHERIIKHCTKLESNSNPLLQLLPRDNVIRRLKRQWPADLWYGEPRSPRWRDLIKVVSPQVRLTTGTLACRILCTVIADWNK